MGIQRKSNAAKKMADRLAGITAINPVWKPGQTQVTPMIPDFQLVCESNPERDF